MSKTINVKHLNDVFSDEVFVRELFAMEAPEDAQAALKEKGVEVSIEELQSVNRILSRKLSENGELSLDDLDDVSGGAFIFILGVGIGLGKAVAAGAVIAGGVAVGGVAVGGVAGGGIATGILAATRRW